MYIHHVCASGKLSCRLVKEVERIKRAGSGRLTDFRLFLAELDVEELDDFVPMEVLTEFVGVAMEGYRSVNVHVGTS